MIFPAPAFARFVRCPVIYDLHDLQGVPMPPTTRQVLSRIVRGEVKRELQSKLATQAIPDARGARLSVEQLSQEQFAQDIAYTPDEAARGQRTAFERTLTRAWALVGLWRAAVAPRIEPIATDAAYEFKAREHSITGYFECVTQDGNRLTARSTRVRSRRPAKDETAQNQVLFLPGKASPDARGACLSWDVTVDYLIDSDPLSVETQSVERSESIRVALQERVLNAARAVEAGVFTPTDPQNWKCLSCSLRECCRFV